MTIEALNTRDSYPGNGSADTFNYSFRILAKTDLRVTVQDDEGVETTLVLNTDYSVASPFDNEGGGSITLVDADQEWVDSDGDLASGYTLTIRRVRPLTQSTDLRNQGDGWPASYEDALDHLVMLCQQQQDEIDRSLKLPESEDGSAASTTLPNADDRASKFLAFDADGNPVASSGGIDDAIPVSAFMETVLDDADAAAARATLGALDSGDLATLENDVAEVQADITTLEALGRWESGDVKWSGRSTPSAGWLLCDGSAVSRTTYATLFSAIGTTFGSGDGSTTFNVPDLKGRSPMGAGAGSGLTSRSLGTKTGAESTALPNHQHNTATDSATGGSGGSSVGGKFGGGDQTYVFTINGGAQTWQKLRFHTNTDGGGASIAVVQPSLVLNAFIKT